jgi:hypothetical protein
MAAGGPPGIDLDDRPGGRHNPHGLPVNGPASGSGIRAVYVVTGLIVNYAGEFMVEPWLNNNILCSALGLEEQE